MSTRPPKESYSVDSYRRAIARACKEAKVPVWTPHQLRHSAGTSVRAEFDAETARVVLGHENLSTTEIYSERDLETAAKAIAEIG